MTEKRMRRKNGKRSKILSGTPYKEALEIAENEKEQKKRTIEDKKIKRKLFADQNAKQNTHKKKRTGTVSIPSTSTAEDNSEVKCPACLETYEDPPRENWIRCQVV